MDDDKTVIVGQAFRLAPGTRLNGIYQIDSLLDIGGMSEIYRGHNIQTLDDVAIKVVLPEFANDEDILSLFKREALTLNRLNHEAIVRYHVFTQDPERNLHYLAMEFVEGPTLRNAMKKRALTQAEACTLIRKVAQGLAAAHRDGVIHRDVSTDNIVLRENDINQPKIIDFGIARTDDRNDSTLISNGFAGKYSFVSPEQLGLFGGKVSVASDIYSLGLVFAAALLGRPLDMTGTHADVVSKRQSVPDLSHINPGVKPLIERMLQPNPSARPESMTEVAEAIGRLGPAAPRRRIQDLVDHDNPETLPPAEKPRTSAFVRLSLLAFFGGGLWLAGTETDFGRKLVADATGLTKRFIASSKDQLAGKQPKQVSTEGKSQTQLAPKPDSTEASTKPTEETPTAPQPSVDKTTAETVVAKTEEPPEAPKPVEQVSPTKVETSQAPSVQDDTAEPASKQIPPAEEANPTDETSEPSRQTETAAQTAEDSTTDATTVESNVPAVEPIVDATEQTTTQPADPIVQDDQAAQPAETAERTGEEPPVTVPEAAEEKDEPTETALLAPSEPRTEPVEPPKQTGPSEWVRAFDGGTCFMANGGDPFQGKVKITGYGNQVAPFEKLDEQFQAKFGYEAEIGLRLVSDQQCALVDFVRDVNTTERRMAFSMPTDVIRGNSPISARLSDVEGESLGIFIATASGVLVNVTPASTRFGDESVLNLPGDSLASKAGDGYLLFAVSSQKPLAALKMQKSEDIDAFVRTLKSEAGNSPLQTTLKYFRKN